MSWKDTKLTGDPILVVGLRDEHRRLEAFRVNVDTGVHADLRRIAAEALQRVQGMTGVEYSPYVGQQPEEYLTLDPATLVATHREVDSEGVSSERQEAAALVTMVQQADVLPEIGAGQLIARLAGDFYVQGICLRDGGERIGFVTKASARQVLKRSAIPLGKDDPNDRLKKITRPELVLESSVHAIIASGEVAILNRPQFQFLVSDAKLVFNHVPEQVRQLAGRFRDRGVPLTAATQEALTAKSLSSIQVAKRLDALAERVAQVHVDKIRSGAGFRAQDLARSDFVNTDNEIECHPSRVLELLDALEGRYFSDAFSSEKRRADSFRRR